MSRLILNRIGAAGLWCAFVITMIALSGTAAADSVSGTSGQVTLAPGLCNGATCTSYNAGTQTAPAGATIAQQLFYVPVSAAGTQTVAGTDGGKLWTATVNGVTFQTFAPGAIGTTGINFGYNGTNGYTITTPSGVIYGCGVSAASVSVAYAASLTSDGTNWMCSPSGGVGLAGTNTFTGTNTFATVLGSGSNPTTTPYTFLPTDCGQTVLVANAATAVTETIPAAIAPPAGKFCNIVVIQGGTAKVSVNGTATGAAVLISADSFTGTSGAQGAAIGIALTTVGATATAYLTGRGS